MKTANVSENQRPPGRMAGERPPMMLGMDLSERYSSARRILRLLKLLRVPRTLDELRAELGVSGVQLRRDLALLREEGFVVAEQGKPKSVWLESEDGTEE